MLLVRTALAGPPYQTDDPEPVAPGEYELHIASELTKASEGISGSLPFLELNCGPAPNLQIGIGVPHELNDPDHAPSHSGLGDIELSVKYRFQEETHDLPMMAFFPMVALPAGDSDEDLGNAEEQWFLPLWLQKNWGDWQSNAGGGYWINHANDASNHWFFGWQLQKRISGSWTLGGEIFHGTEEAPGEGASTGFSIGSVYELDDNNRLLVSAGRGLSNVQTLNQFSSYIGYQLNW